MSLSNAPTRFAFGLVCGLVARCSGGLLAPIVLHATFNLIAGLLLLTTH